MKPGLLRPNATLPTAPLSALQASAPQSVAIGTHAGLGQTHHPLATIPSNAPVIPPIFSQSLENVRKRLGLPPLTSRIPVVVPPLPSVSDAELVVQWRAQAGKMRLPDTDDPQEIGRFLADDNAGRMGPFYRQGGKRNSVRLHHLDSREFLAFHESRQGKLDPDLLALVRADRSTERRYRVVAARNDREVTFDDISPKKGLSWKPSPNPEKAKYYVFLPSHILEKNLEESGLRIKYLPYEPESDELFAWQSNYYRVVSVRAGNPRIDLEDRPQIPYALFQLHDWEHAYFVQTALKDHDLNVAFGQQLRELLSAPYPEDIREPLRLVYDELLDFWSISSCADVIAVECLSREAPKTPPMLALVETLLASLRGAVAAGLQSAMLDIAIEKIIEEARELSLILR